MAKRAFQLLLVGLLFSGVTCALWAAEDPFVRQWKLNPSKSKLTDEMKVHLLQRIHCLGRGEQTHGLHFSRNDAACK